MYDRQDRPSPDHPERRVPLLLPHQPLQERPAGSPDLARRAARGHRPLASPGTWSSTSRSGCARQSLSAPVRYAELAAELGVEMGDQAAAGEVRAAVIKIRSRKGMVLNPGDPDTRSAGSFFTNPVHHRRGVRRRRGAAAARGAGQVPRYPAGDGPGQGSRRLADRALRLRQGLRCPRPGPRLVQAHPRARQRGRGHDRRSPRAGPRDRRGRPRRLRRHPDPRAHPGRRHPLTRSPLVPARPARPYASPELIRIARRRYASPDAVRISPTAVRIARGRTHRPSAVRIAEAVRIGRRPACSRVLSPRATRPQSLLARGAPRPKYWGLVCRRATSSVHECLKPSKFWA